MRTARRSVYLVESISSITSVLSGSSINDRSFEQRINKNMTVTKCAGTMKSIDIDCTIKIDRFHSLLHRYKRGNHTKISEYLDQGGHI